MLRQTALHASSTRPLSARKIAQQVNQQEEEKWKEVQAKLQIGDEVEGKIVHKAPFGDFIDIGVGFPALLQIVDMRDLTPEKYREGNYSQIENIVKARIIEFRDYNKQIILTQKSMDLKKI